MTLGGDITLGGLIIVGTNLVALGAAWANLKAGQSQLRNDVTEIKHELGNGTPGKFVAAKECGLIHTALLDRMERWDELQRENWHVLNTRANVQSDSLKTIAIQLAALTERSERG